MIIRFEILIHFSYSLTIRISLVDFLIKIISKVWSNYRETFSKFLRVNAFSMCDSLKITRWHIFSGFSKGFFLLFPKIALILDVRKWKIQWNPLSTSFFVCLFDVANRSRCEIEIELNRHISLASMIKIIFILLAHDIVICIYTTVVLFSTGSCMKWNLFNFIILCIFISYLLYFHFMKGHCFKY